MCNHREFETVLREASLRAQLRPERMPRPLILDPTTRQLSRRYLASLEASLERDRRRQFWLSILKEAAWYAAIVGGSIGLSWWVVAHR